MRCLLDCCEPDCPNRTPGCHGKCERYKNAKEAYEKRKAELRKEKIGDEYMFDLIHKRMNQSAIRKSRYRRTNPYK